MQMKCQWCGKTVTVPDVTPEQMHAWRTGALIQVAMPHLTADEREMVKTQTCDECWDKFMAE
jgi:hypothetical protein